MINSSVQQKKENKTKKQNSSVKMLQFEKVVSFHPKTELSHLKTIIESEEKSPTLFIPITLWV